MDGSLQVRAVNTVVAQGEHGDMDSALSTFSALTASWFRRSLGTPTEVQREAWPVIASGGNALVSAPTGSGKTLAAFLYAIDRLFVEHQASAPSSKRRPAGVRVLYISPLKALGADVARNLSHPLQGIMELAEKSQPSLDSGDVKEISVAVRSGDSTPKQRRAIASHPPEILVTTPESLYLMLTSKTRGILETVDTVIVDEIHALAGNKRGAHLALSLERLDSLAQQPIQRIGLSATVRPLDEVARFLGGTQPVRIVSAPGDARMDLSVVEPLANMRDLTTSASDDERSGASIWPDIERQVLDIVLRHRTTLVFVNSRGLAEKLTARLNDLHAQSLGSTGPAAAARSGFGDPRHFPSTIGPSSQMVVAGEDQDAIAMAHHGSVSKERRKRVEEDLKAGRLRCVVATSSLELGIDMGSVDMVVQIAEPLSVSSAVQRVGRADHRVGGVSHAVFFPLTRGQIAGTAAIIESMRSGAIEAIRLPSNPLDILAQQTVAEAAMGELDAEQWYARVRRAAPFARLSRNMYEAVLGMLSGRYTSGDFSAFRPILNWDRESASITARPGAQRLAVTSGGTIPDRGSFSVLLPETDSASPSRRVGELDEEMVYESRVGDVITLGTSTWQIREITRDRVIVLPAPGRSARLPFWHGEGVGRDAEYGASLGAFLREVSQGLLSTDDDVALRRKDPEESESDFDQATETRLIEDGLDRFARGNLASLLREQRLSTGIVPDDRNIVVERCRDEEGDWRIIVHSPYGRRVHEPWAMAISARIRESYGHDGAVYAADNGIVLRMPDSESTLAARELLAFDTEALEKLLRSQIGQSALFAARFRECAARALFMPRQDPGRRMPLWQQRLRASQLLGAARSVKNFPLVLESTRECLQDVYDIPGLKALMDSINGGAVRLLDRQTATPSPFAASLLFGYTGAFLYAGDAPQAERNASTLSVDPEVLEGLLGDIDVTELLDDRVMAESEAELQRTADDRHGHGAEGIADLLRVLGPLSSEEVAERWDPQIAHGDMPAVRQEDRAAALEDDLGWLKHRHRIVELAFGGHEYWVNAQDAQALDGGHRDAALRDIVLRYAKTHAPFSTRTIADRFALDHGESMRILGDLQLHESLLDLDGGENADDGPDLDRRRWLHSSVFRILRSRSLRRIRRSIAAVGADVYQDFLLRRQGVGAPGQGVYQGESGLLRVIEQLEGLALPAAVWESDVFVSRVRDYSPGMLDALLASGEVIWLGSSEQGQTQRQAQGRSQGQALMQRIAFYLADSPLLQGRLHMTLRRIAMNDRDAQAQSGEGGGAERQSHDPSLREHVLRLLSSGGAFLSNQLAPVGSDDSLVSHELWSLVWEGRLTNGTFAPVRAHLEENAPMHRGRRRGTARALRARPGLRSGLRAMMSGHAELSGLWRAPFTTEQMQDSLADASLSSRRMSTEATEGATERLHEQATAAYLIVLVESLLDRYGVISPAVVNGESIEGGFSALYPVLRRMEEHGSVVRGMYIQGFGAAQFANADTVNLLRSNGVANGADRSQAALAEGPGRGSGKPHADSPDARQGIGQDCVVLDTSDPANLYGSALNWPASAVMGGATVPSETVSSEAVPSRQTASEDAAGQVESSGSFKASRRFGSAVVIIDGRAVLYANPKGHRMLLFAGADESDQRQAFAALAAYFQRHAKASITFSQMNGKVLLSDPAMRAMMQDASFVPVPQGMRLYR